MSDMDIWAREFTRNAVLVAQQEGSAVWPYFNKTGDVQGSRIYFDKYGSVEFVPKVSTGGLVTPMNQSKSRRAAIIADFYAAIQIGKSDIQRQLTDPKSAATTSMGWAAGRKLDKIAVASLNAAATDVTSSDGGTLTEGTTALPSAQIITDLTNNLTVDKVDHAHQILDVGMVPKPGRILLIGASQRRALFGNTSTVQLIGSSDYINDKPFAQTTRPVAFGWNGCTVVQYEDLPLVSTTRYCFMFHPMFIGVGVGQDPQITVTQEQLLGRDYLAYGDLSAGAVRIQEVGVVQINCVES